MKVKFGLPILILLALAFSGCSSLLEKQAWKDVREIEEKYKGVNELRSNDLPDLEKNSDLGDFLAYSLLKNANLESEFNKWKASLEKIPQVRSLPDPKFTYGYYVREVETRVGPQKNRFGLSQTFPWIGTLLLKGEAAMQNAEAQRQQYEAEKLKVFSKVKEVYYEYYYLGRSIDIIKRNLALFKELEKVATEKFESAKFVYPDLIRIQIETVKFAERVDSLNDFREPVMAKFSHVLNWDQHENTTPFPYPSTLKVIDVNNANFGSYRESVKQNPRLKEIEHYIAREERNRQIALRRYIPDVSLGVDYIQTDRSSMSVSDNGKDPIIAMVSVNLPIYFTKYEAERREAIAKKIAFENKKIDTEKLLLSTVEKDLFMIKDSKRKMLVYRDNLIPKAEKSLQVIKHSYIAGDASYLDFIDAQQTLLKFELIYEENLVKYAKAIARVEELIGKEISGNLMEKNNGK